MGCFSRFRKAADPTAPCSHGCAARFEKRKAIIARARETVRFKRESGASEESLKPIEDAADRFDRDNEAAVRARAAANVYDQSKAGECLSNLSRDLEKLNKELELDPGTFTREDFENPHTGYRAALYKSGSNGHYILSFAGTDPHALSDWQTNIDNGAG